jgi:hypothetical protein
MKAIELEHLAQMLFMLTGPAIKPGVYEPKRPAVTNFNGQTG